MRLYRYVGSKRIAARVGSEPTGVPIRSPGDVTNWIAATGQHGFGGCVVVTFIVDEQGTLLIADRRSEHVACAGGRPVRSAGEITFALNPPAVVAVGNQSTGYCPEPESWPAVVEALSRAGMPVPDGFILSCEFRRCVGCESLNLVKSGVFECGVCGAELPAGYNVQDVEP
jgi:hypothetical protein